MTSAITFSGSGSGLPVSDWIEAMVAAQRASVEALYTKQTTLNSSKTALSTVESKFSSLKTSILKFTDANIASSFDLFASREAKSSDTNIATVTAANNTAIQNFTLSVDSLASATKANSGNLSKYIEGSELFTDVANKQGSLTLKHTDGTEYGKFSIYANGVKNEITIEKTDTLNDIVKKINDQFDPTSDEDYSDNTVRASIANGKLSITYDNSAVTNLTLGNSSDSTNFLNIMQLSTAEAVDNGDGTSNFTSLLPINTIDFGGNIIGNEANLDVNPLDPITAGTFTIGEAEFTIDENTTLSSLISKINSDDDAGVTAQFDTKSNKLVLSSKDPGKTAINLENGTSNFLTKIGLITEGGDSLASQTLGENAKIRINGSETPLEVNSNTVSGDISGLTGVTITLKKTTQVTNGETTTDNPITINVEENSEGITSAVSDFIDKFNSMSSMVSSQTGKNQSLRNEYSLITLKNTMRSMLTGRVSGIADFDNLAMIGISTGAIGKAASDTSNNLILDKEKLLDALRKNPSEVKTLLIGDSKAGITGVFQKLQDKLNTVLDPVNGYFKAKNETISAMISSNDKSIARGEDRITAYKKRITQQFAQMDQYISQMQQQSNAISSIKF